MTEPAPLGVLELTSRGAGFLRRAETGYLPADSDVHVPERLIRSARLRAGDEITGTTAPGGKGRGRSASLATVTAINGRDPASLAHRPEFGRLGAVHPNAMLELECGILRRGQPDFTNRVIDLLCPFGKGQRALIVAPAKAGKTTVLQNIAEGISTNHPAATLFILLVDERPEEVFEMEASGFGEVIASSFDQPASSHVAVAELTLERARRRVELGEDVVIIMDSLTRLARAYNTVERGTGRTLSGGLDANSLEKPKKFLGSARRIDPAQGGGSLTIIATALVDTGSKMDQVIFEEFKGTGNSELVLSRELAERRVFPAVDLVASATRREELLLSPEALAASHRIRERIAGMTPLNAMNDLLTDLRRMRTNDELVRSLATAGGR
ncbi:MAG TPA: transcription termination factor Rho [Gemmatimonadales bacterium]|nr:transcription termination factor Rho [Gemmatimonadales bacterium]